MTASPRRFFIETPGHERLAIFPYGNGQGDVSIAVAKEAAMKALDFFNGQKGAEQIKMPKQTKGELYQCPHCSSYAILSGDCDRCGCARHKVSVDLSTEQYEALERLRAFKVLKRRLSTALKLTATYGEAVRASGTFGQDIEGS